MHAPFRQKAREIIQHKNCEITNHPHSLKNKIFGKRKKVTVVTAAFNAEKFISRTIDSVINQTLGFDQIQFIIVDDHSSDNTRRIVSEYAAKHKNICLVSLHENTGSPGTPRNIGIELADSAYITFLDADDWLAPGGLEELCNILDDTNDDYAVGKTIKVQSASQSIIGEFASIKERRSISPFDVPHFFYHMGPTARMVRLSLIKENDIGFPEMVFAEDKLFFFDVLFSAKAVSTTTKPIYYANRTDENTGSLTRETNVLDKRRSDLKVIEYIKSKNLPADHEKVALNRIYEYDIVRTFDSMLFVNSKEKHEFLAILDAAIETAENLRYDFRDSFHTPLYKEAVNIYMEQRTEDFIKLFTWLKKDKNKKYAVINNLPYYELPFLHDEKKHIEIPMLARALDSYIIDNIYYQDVEVYGRDISQINSILIRDRNRINNEILVDFEWKDKNLGYFKVELNSLDKLTDSLFTIFIRYNEYQIINIKRILSNQISYKDKTIKFYTTIANNLGLSIKAKE
ncbi:glycosyltransferase family 2 protein [Cytobacillus firmus]|uniref:Glycosyltransferase n=1 Tax=Cytobacillus firmus TaxID=1399 RepID=A0AA46PMR0_CYTFI|nr:glycosyltransferase family 2 protein [Cytobacillus firmus]UYG93855.1 glycosyltransferase [Cytobacillus firmus]